MNKTVTDDDDDATTTRTESISLVVAKYRHRSLDCRQTAQCRIDIRSNISLDNSEFGWRMKIILQTVYQRQMIRTFC